MSAKCLDQQGRWRNKVVAFRMSPEEDELLETAVRLSGLTKQEYIIRRLQEKEVVVTGGFIGSDSAYHNNNGWNESGIKEPLSVGKHLKAGIW